MSKSFGKLKALFDKVGGHVKIDAKLAKRISDFQTGFVNKNEEHMTFFGGNLTGVQIVRFTEQDKNKFFTDVVEIDDLEVDEGLLKVDVIDPNWHVATDSFNHTCFWLIHKFMINTTLHEKVRQRAMLDLGLLLYFRFLTSLLFRYFKYPADPQTAAMTYAQLSERFMIKQYGSWFATLEARSEKLIESESIHYNTLKTYDDDSAVVKMIADTQGRIRDMMKNIYAKFKEVHDRGSKVKTTSLISDHDGEMIMKDKTRSLTIYSRYMRSVVSDETSFVKDEIIDILEKVVHTASPNHLRACLKWCSQNYKYANLKIVEDLLDKTLLHSFNYLADNRNIARENNDLTVFITKLKGVYMSSRSTDTDLLEIRDIAEDVVKKATNTKNSSAIASVRTALLLYIVIRAFTMTHYSGTQ